MLILIFQILFGVNQTKKIYIDDKGYRFENWSDTLNFLGEE